MDRKILLETLKKSKPGVYKAREKELDKLKDEELLQLIAGPDEVSTGTEGIDPRWLKGLVYRGRKEGKPVEKDGRKVKTFTPVEREMKATDVLSFRIEGNEVVIVTADGQKVRVKK